MSKPILAMVGDLHLARHAWARHPSLWGDAYYALEQILAYCLAKKTPLILAGDVLDSAQPSAETVRVVRTFLNCMEEAALRVFVVAGQHDRASPNWLQAIHPWATHVDQRQFTVAGLRWYGLDWRPEGEIHKELACVPTDTEAVVAHQVWGDLVGPVIRSECRFAEVPRARLLLTGDYHKHVRAASKGAGGQDLAVLSPGATAQQAVDEPVEKFFFALCDDGVVESVPLLSRPFRRFELSNADQLDAFLAGAVQHLELDLSLPDHLQRPALWIRYDAEIPGVYDRLAAEVGGEAHLFLSPVRPRAVEQAVPPEARRECGGHMVDSLRLVCEPDSAVYRDAVRLLASGDAASELMTMRSECGL